jgi:uncharacterized protein (DUF1684 family)
MKLSITPLILVLITGTKLLAQTSGYNQNLKTFQANYVETHEVVKGKDRKYFRFFPVDSAYRIIARFEKIDDTIGFTMKTSGAVTKQYYRYGKLSFRLRDTLLELFMYQSRELMKTDAYKNYLFIPFTDITSGDESYGSGRYLDFTIGDIANNGLVIDFNKAYNPYCAYASGFHCPLPPKENFLKIRVIAGE